MESLLLGMSLGLVAGLIPGAFSTVVATTALERGMGPGLKVAAIPLVTEIPVMLAAVFVLSRLPVGALRWIGIAGGVLLIVMAWKVFRDVRNHDPLTANRRSHGGHFLRVALFGLLAPGAWAFWFFVGAPLLLNRWHVGPAHGLAFLAGFMVCFIGAMLALAWAAASGRRYLSVDWYRRTMKAAGGLLIVVGIVLIWQSWVGNFTEMVVAPGEVERRIDGS
jgi:threonine/homoserine/homoserine lactone efflux protein